MDTRGEMASWIGRHLSPTAILTQEGWEAIKQGVPSQPEMGQVPIEVITVPRLISFGSVDGIRRAGVTHILLQQAIYGCHVDPAASLSTNASVQAFAHGVAPVLSNSDPRASGRALLAGEKSARHLFLPCVVVALCRLRPRS